MDGNLAITELKRGFGARILDIDLAASSDAVLDEAVRVFDLHGAILLRDQKMTPDDLVRFVARLDRKSVV